MSAEFEAALYLAGFACSAAAGVAAILGWVTNTPDGAKRYFRRFAAWGLAIAALTLFGVASHSWWFRGMNFVFILGAYFSAGRWWRATEAARLAERRLSYLRGNA